MTVDAFRSAILTLCGREPFRPFKVELVGGRRFEIDRANAVACRDGLAVFMAAGGVPTIFDHNETVAIAGDASA